MITRAPSNQKTYDVYWTGDSALRQPPTAPADEADATTKAKYERDKAEYEHALTLARETGGKWDELVLPGHRPTKFVMKPMSGSIRRLLMDRLLSGRIGAFQMNAIAFRIALEAIENFDDFQLDKPVLDRDYGTLASEKVVEELDKIDPSIVDELGQDVLRRARGVSPKS